MKYIPNSHIYATDLEAEIKMLSTHLEKCPLLTGTTILNDVANDTTVVFNNQSAPYVKDNFSDLVDKIKKMRVECRSDELTWDLEQILSSLEHNDICGEGIYSPWFDSKNRQYNSEIADQIADIRKTILNTHCGYMVNSLYDHKTRTITIYTKNIGSNYEDYLAAFCYQFFSAVHHSRLDLCRRKEKLDRYYHSVVLKSLATYFQIDYLYSRGFSDKAKEIKDSMLNLSPVFYPYSGSHGIENHNHFCELLKMSLYDFEASLRDMVNRYDADIIMEMKNPKVLFPKVADAVSTPPACTDSEVSRVYPNVYKVHQKGNFFREVSNEYIYGGGHWKLVGAIRKGDIILHETKDSLVAVSIAKSDSFLAEKHFFPDEIEGFYVKCHYDMLKNPLPLEAAPQQVYISKVNLAIARYLMERICAINEDDAIADIIRRALK